MLANWNNSKLTITISGVLGMHAVVVIVANSCMAGFLFEPCNA